LKEKNQGKEKQEEAHNSQKDNRYYFFDSTKAKKRDLFSFFNIQYFMKTILIYIFLAIVLNASTLNLSISSNPSRINPILATDSASSEISQWIFNGLFKYNKDAQIVCDLAKSYYFKTPTKLIISLKKNVKWHDGKPFTANDVIFTYNTINSKKVFTPLKSEFQKVKSLKKLDDFTLEVNYKQPYFKALQIWMTGILPKHILQNEKDLMTSSFNKHPIGTGAYKLDSFTISNDIELYANDNYFDKRAKIDKLLYKFLPDSSTEFYTLKQGNLDVGGLTPMQKDRQIDQNFKKRFKIYEQPSFGYTYIGFNLTSKKFKNKKIREALSLGINRKQLVDILFFGSGKVCTGPFLPGTFAFNDKVKIPKQNITKAKAILKSLGYDKNHKFKFTLITNSNNSIRVNAAQIIQYQLSKINVDMKIRVMEWQAFLNTIVMPRNFDAILLGWGLSLMPDAKPLWHSKSAVKGGFNLVNYSNKDVDRLIEEAETTVDKNKLSTIYKKIFFKITQDLPYLFLYIPNSITAVNKNIKNVTTSIIGVMHNEKDWIKE